MSLSVKQSQALGLVGAFYGPNSPETVSCSLVNKTASQWTKNVLRSAYNSPDRNLAKKKFAEIEFVQEERKKWLQKHASLIKLDRTCLSSLPKKMIDEEIGENGQTDLLVCLFGKLTLLQTTENEDYQRFMEA